jgi:hypothetical protein
MAFTTAFVFQVEEMMHSAVRDVIDGCLDTCSITPRNEWIQDWPSQVATYQLQWNPHNVITVKGII